MYQRTATLEPTLPHPVTRGSRTSLVVGGGIWLAVTLAIALSGAFATVRPLAPIVVFGSIAAGVLAYRYNAAMRAFADRVDLRIPIAIHVVRVVAGAKILAATSAGIMPELFGHRAGPGDIAVGVLALVVAGAVPAATLSRGRVRIVLAWCAIGILDLAIAFSTAQYLIWVVDDPRMVLIADLPWSLLPAIVVPTLILAHLLVIARVRRGYASQPPASTRSPS